MRRLFKKVDSSYRYCDECEPVFVFGLRRTGSELYRKR